MSSSQRSPDTFGHINRAREVDDAPPGAGGEDVSDVFASFSRPKFGADGRFSSKRSVDAEGPESSPHSGADRVRIGVGRIRPDSGSRSGHTTTRSNQSGHIPINASGYATGQSKRSSRTPTASSPSKRLASSPMHIGSRRAPEDAEEDESSPVPQRSVAAADGQAHYDRLKARIEAAKSSLDRMSNETGNFNTQMNHIESEFTWWSDKVAAADCDEDWDSEMPSWDQVYTKICRPGTAAGVPSKSKRLGDSTFLTTEVDVVTCEEPVTEFISESSLSLDKFASPPSPGPGTSTRVFKRASIARSSSTLKSSDHFVYN